MTRRPAIPTAAPSLVVSHGADFFGEDRHLVKDVAALAPWVCTSLAWVDREQTALLAAAMEAPENRTFPPAEAAAAAEILLRLSRVRQLRPKPSALARALADAAARAAADGEPWTWTVDTAHLRTTA
jgi:hypothetical protein